MCVILIGDNKRPSERMVAQAYAKNDHGAGFAHRVVGNDGEMYVQWKKGLDLAEIQKLVAETPMPFIAHFRIASIGGIRDELTHPFEISTSAEPDLEGRTKNYVLFHNGHWGEWLSFLLSTVRETGTPIPFGKWSDSRAMAWLAAVYSQGFLELMDKQKIVTFGPNDMNFLGDSDHWKEVDGVYCSNDAFVNQYVPGFSSPQTARSSGSGSDECEHPTCSKRSSCWVGGRKVCYEHVSWVPKAATLSTAPCSMGNCTQNALWGDRYCMEHSEHFKSHNSDGSKSAAGSAQVFEGAMIAEKGGTPSKNKQERDPFEKLLHSGIRVSQTSHEMVLKVAEREFELGPKVSRLSKNAIKRIRSEVEQRRWELKQQAIRGSLALAEAFPTQGLPS